MKKIKLTLIAVSIGLISLVGCQKPTPVEKVTKTTRPKLGVTVSIVPQKYFVERIGGDNFSVNVMVLPGANHEIYEPKAEQLRSLANSTVYFTIGLLPFEKTWLERISTANKNMLIVDTSQGLELETMDHDHYGHHEKDDSHQEGDLDPHIWLSPKLVKKQANTIYETLIKIDPENVKEYQHNLEDFVDDIEEIDQKITKKLEGLTNRKFMVFHPNWGYFAKDYNLEMIAIEVEGKEPTPKELTNIIKEGKKENIKVVFADPEFSTSTVENVAKKIGAEVLLINPLAHNWLENMQEIADKMYTSLTNNKSIN